MSLEELPLESLGRSQNVMIRALHNCSIKKCNCSTGFYQYISLDPPHSFSTALAKLVSESRSVRRRTGVDHRPWDQPTAQSVHQILVSCRGARSSQIILFIWAIFKADLNVSTFTVLA